jgi:hypothetical protein
MSDRLTQVLAHPLRDRVLFEYQGEPTSPARVARRLGRPVNLISYHTAVLVQHGCLTLVRAERHRGALEHFYRSTIGQIVADDEWEAAPTPLRRALVLATLRAIDEEAREAVLTGGFDAQGAALARIVLEADDEGVRAVSDVLRHAYDEIERIVDASRGRSGLRTIEVALLAFERDADASETT